MRGARRRRGIVLVKETAMAGSLNVLNVCEGDTKLIIGDDPRDIEVAERTIADMLRRGYALFVEVDGGPAGVNYVKVDRYDPKFHEYIVSQAPAIASPTAAPAPALERLDPSIQDVDDDGPPPMAGAGTTAAEDDDPHPGRCLFKNAGKRCRLRAGHDDEHYFKPGSLPKRLSIHDAKVTAVAPARGG